MHAFRAPLRQLTSRPAVAIMVVFTLALAIGANALVFSTVRAVLLRPLPFEEPRALVAVWETQPGVATRGVAPANFLDWRGARSFEALAAYSPRSRSLAGDDPQRITVAAVSANFFDVLRVRASLGRTFRRTIPAGVTRELVMREDFWRRHFSGDPSILGRSIRLDDETVVVAGVIPTHLGFPEDVVAWTQAPHDVPELGGVPGDIRSVRDAWYFRVVGRLKPGVSREEAQSEMNAIASRLRETYPTTNHDAGVNVVDLHKQVTGAPAPMLWMLAVVVACVLAVACANVAVLMLAAALGRGRELSIRSALGASRARLIGQLTIESVVLATCGGALGLALAWSVRPALIAMLPSGMPRASSIGIDGGVVIFALALCALTALLCGAAPAVIATRPCAFTSLRDGGRSAGSRSGVRLASALVVAQLGIVLALLTGTGLMLRTLSTLYHRDVGIDVERLLAIDVTLPDARSRGRAAAALDIQRMVDRLAALPGVTSAAAVQTLPLAARGPSARIRVEGRTFRPNEAPDVVWKTVTPEYFAAVGAVLRRGRAFTPADRAGSQPVTVINARLAELLWPDQDPIGKRIGTGLDGDGAPVEIVGVVGDTPQEGIGSDVLPEMYRPLAQPARFGVDAMSLLVRTQGEPQWFATAARHAVRDVHPQAPVAAVRPLTAVVDAGVADELAAARALATFGALALVLAVVGLYGVMARLVGERTRELGVRLALGAEPRALRRLVLRRTLKLAACGVAAGALGSVVISRQLGSLLHGVSGSDPMVFSVSAVVLVAAALGASWLPARRASRVDPLIVLKGE